MGTQLVGLLFLADMSTRIFIASVFLLYVLTEALCQARMFSLAANTAVDYVIPVDRHADLLRLWYSLVILVSFSGQDDFQPTHFLISDVTC